jgi:proline racemase
VPGQKFVHESLIGSRYESTIESLTEVGANDAFVPSVAGQAWITDMSQVGLDPTDPFPLGVRAFRQLDAKQRQPIKAIALIIQ